MKNIMQGVCRNMQGICRRNAARRSDDLVDFLPDLRCVATCRIVELIIAVVSRSAPKTYKINTRNYIKSQ